ncbi:MAG: hypothetical protein WB709_00110 [Solirubrobacteraceae bacterium]
MLFVFTLAMTSALLFCGGVANAEAPRLIPAGQLESAGALGVTVDQVHGDIYVAGFLGFRLEPFEISLGRVNKFDGAGKLLSPPSPIGEGPPYSGIAVNPTNGNIYALSTSGEINVYDPATGAPILSFAVESSNNYFNLLLGSTTVVDIATDATGNVYVPVVPKNEVLEYSPTGELLKTFTGGSGAGALRGPMGVAVDGAGNLWVADTGNGRIEELTPSDDPVSGGVIAAEGVGSVALDDHGDVFAIVDNSADFCGKIKPPCSHLVEYDSTGMQVADLGAGSIGAAQFNAEEVRQAVPDMVAVSDITGVVYVTEAVFSPPAGRGFGRVLQFRPPVAPMLEGETAVEVGVSDAKLGAVVDPGGVNASYHFEYGTTTAYGQTAPFPEGDTGAGFTSRTVWAGASGLQPGTTYHYRVVVTSEVGGVIVGEDHTFTTGAASRATCPNEMFRTGFSAALPDCRAYELVTPPNKQGAQPDKDEGGNGRGELSVVKTLQGNFAAVDGNRLSFKSEDVQPGSPSAGESYVATRGPSGWAEEDMFPPTNFYGFECAVKEENLHLLQLGYSEDLSRAIISIPGGGECGVEPELVRGEPRGSQNLFVRDNATGTYELVNGPEEEGVDGFVPAAPTLLGESSDFGRIVFAEEAKLTKDAPVGVNNVYEWSAGHVRLVTVLPDGTPVAGSFAGISKDGSRVFFIAEEGNLYARVDDSETTQLDASQASGTGGGGTFQSASQDGSVVFFTDDASAELTADTVPNSGTNLYRYDSTASAAQRLTDLTPVSNAVSPAVSGVANDGSVVFFTDDASAKLTGDTNSGSGTNLYRYEAADLAGHHLTDLTPVAQAEVQSVLGVSEDGSSVYFKAAGALTSQPNQHDETAQSGQPNMYVSHGDGALTFIAINSAEGASFGRFKLSANGRFLAFESVRKLTEYDNTNPSTGELAVELYLYDAAANSLACASCNPSGQAPTAGGAGGGGIENAAFEETLRSPRYLSENGRLFFDSPEGLLPADTNGSGGCSLASGVSACDDVYEFEPAGVGSCAEPIGCLYLISTGTGASETLFIDASPSGNDVFIREYQKLVPRDAQDGVPSLYDVRVDGGFLEPSPPPVCTTPEACRTASPSRPPIFGMPASQTFSGAGNLVASVPSTPKPPVKCKKGYVKKKGKCVKKKPKKKARKSTRRKRGR